MSLEYQLLKGDEPNHADLAKRFTELTGGCWHEWKGNNPIGNVCSCGSTCGNISEHIEASNPTYSNAADILNVMWERKDCYGFIENIVKAIKYKTPLNVLAYFINDYILNPTALLREAVEFLEQMIVAVNAIKERNKK